MVFRKTKNSRRHFIKKGAAAIAGATILPSVLKGESPKKPPKDTKDKKQIFRTLGKTGIKLPIVSMGVMNADNPKLVEAALDGGIIHLDTAHGYQRGRNEEMIGKVIKNRPRDSFVLGTKIYETRDRKTGLFPKDAKSSTIIEKFEISLKRLGLDYVDILYLHSIPRKESAVFEPYMSALQKLKKDGKTRFIGVSTHVKEPEVIRATVDSKVYDVILTAYNFRQPHLNEVKEAIAYAAKAGLGVVAMKTQAGVFWDRERQHPINMKASLKWALQNENIHTSIPGFTTFDQLNLDMTVMEDLTLTPEEKADLRMDKTLAMNGLYCSQCQKCLGQCSEKLEIPSLMRSFMYAYGYRNIAKARDTIKDLNLPADPCNRCSTCRVDCTMGFDVQKRVSDIVRLKDIPEDFLG